MIEIAIVEDSQPAQELILTYIERFRAQIPPNKTGHELSGTVFDHGGQFLSACRANCFDILLLDINLPDIDGLRIAEEIRKSDKNIIIVFITDMAQYAVLGYKVDALDYIVKPVTYPNFKLVMERALARLERRTLGSVTVRTETGLLRLPVEEIVYVEVINHKLIYHTSKGEVDAYGQMRDLEPALKGLGFIRISRYFLVNLRFLKQIKDCTLDLGSAQLQISVRKRKEVLMRVAEFFGE